MTARSLPCGCMAAPTRPKGRIQITLGDLQGYFSTLEPLAPASRARAINAVKSLFSFAQRIGFLTFNPCAALKSPKIKNTLAERILREADVHRLIALEPTPRNRVLLRLLYAGGLRVSEICGLKWRDLQERDGAGQITVYGKGGKTRAILLSADTWTELITIKGQGGQDSPVFASRKGNGHLHPSQVKRIVEAAANRAEIEVPVSPHWLRHAHASHALDRGAPIHLVQATLGHASVATTGKYLHARPEDSSARYLGI
jgi:site-specific recombinase XerD